MNQSPDPVKKDFRKQIYERRSWGYQHHKLRREGYEEWVGNNTIQKIDVWIYLSVEENLQFVNKG